MYLDWTSLVHLIVSRLTSLLSCWCFHLIQLNLVGFGLGSTLACHAVTLLIVRFSMRGKSIPHVLVALIFFIDQVVGSSDVVVTISFHAFNGVLLLKVEVLDQPLQEVWHPWHFLQAWEQARIMLSMLSQIIFHEWVRSNILDTVTSFRICIQYLIDKVFTL